MMPEDEWAFNLNTSVQPVRMQEVPLELRVADTKRLCEKYPDLVPVVVTPGPGRYIHNHDYRYLLSRGMTIGGVCICFRTYLDLQPQDAIIFTVQNNVPMLSVTLGEVYEAYKSEDGYLYFTYKEETF